MFQTLALLLCLTGALRAAEPAPFQLQPGQFPPEKSAHYLAGEMIQMDHVNRTGQLRPDRRSNQRTDDYDRALLFTMLPFGTVRYHGAPAELRDIPIGTHLHGQFYFDAKQGVPVKGGLGQALLLEDDFSFHQRQQRVWRIDAVNLEKGTLTVTGQSLADQKSDEKATVFKVNAATRLWKGRGYGPLTDLAPGQTLLFNVTLATLKGPGLCTDIWLDDESRALASAQQMEVHRSFEKLHGLPGWIETVDNEKGLFTMTLFTGRDPKLSEEFKVKSPIHVLVAEDTLRSYDQVNDRLSAEVLEMKTVPLAPGSSGLQLVIKPVELLEGIRPRRIVRLLPVAWGLAEIPLEEMLWPTDHRLK